jgi:putative phosphotransacetylase
VQSFGNRSLIFNRVKVRVSDSFIKEIHVDVDEANAANLKNGDFVQIVEGSGGN